MQDVTTRTPVVAELVAPQEPTWQSAVGDLLTKAAMICTQHGLDVDSFMHGAWQAYVEARPGFKEQHEELQLVAQLDALRKAGQLGKA